MVLPPFSTNNYLRTIALVLLGVLVLTAGFLVSKAPSPPARTQRASLTDTHRLPGTVKVVRVIDGDTIQLESGQKVRYIGVDTPETVDPRKPVQCFGKEAAAKNRELVQDKYVHLVNDISNTDKYHRLLRYVYVPNAAGSKEIFVNLELVKQGYAHISTFPPDVAHQQDFLTAQQQARNEGRGLWSGC